MQLVLVSILSSLLLLSCTDEIETIQTGEATVRLNFDFNTSRSGANATGKENNINQIGLIFYSNDATGTYKAQTVVNLSSTESAQGSANFTLPEALGVTGTYRVLALVCGGSKFFEGDDMAKFLLACNNKSYAEMKDDVYLKNSNEMSWLLPFCGDATFDNKGDGTSSITVNFTRTVAKITLNNGAGNFHLVGAKVGNFRSSGYMFHQNVYRAGIIRRNDASPYITPVGEHINEGLYAFPNMVGVTAQDDDVTTCLIVSGYYSDTPWVGTIPPTAELCYYRINISRGNAQLQLLKRNNLYNVTITSVNTEGSKDPDEAMKDKVNKINVTINDWEEDNDDNFVTDPDGNYLRYSPKSLNFKPMAEMIKYVNVEVKEGTRWEHSITAGAVYFDAVIDPTNPNRLMVKTMLDGHPTVSNFGKIEIKVFKGETAQELEALKSNISLVQFSKNMETRILSVDGKIDGFDIVADSKGALFEYEVLTGGQNNGWLAEADISTASWVHVKPFGGDGSTLTIKVDGNSSANRTGVVTVYFNGDGIEGPDDPDGNNPHVPSSVKINITQSKSDADITITPTYTKLDPLVVQGVDLKTIPAPNGCSGYYDIHVTSIDNEKYTHYKVISNFNTDDVSLETANEKNYNSKNSIVIASNNKFRIMVKQTLPGDRNLEGDFQITMCDASGNPLDAGLREYLFMMKVETDRLVVPTIYDPTNKDNYMWIRVPETISTDGRMYVYDRDAGTAKEWAEDTKTALPYSSLDPGINSDWMGRMVTSTEVKTNQINIGGLQKRLCPEGWEAPTTEQVQLIAKGVRVAKGIAYTTSDEGVNPTTHTIKSTFITTVYNYGMGTRMNHSACLMRNSAPYPWSSSSYTKTLNPTQGLLSWAQASGQQTTGILRCISVQKPHPIPPTK